ncbi:outer membrane protein TolC [Mucilaginibacter frigoritolerans]|jgi:outer membrane protein|uniref:Outer membrane protein TolC n=1 Tax=Mucilaginibacter frigoritolerans TaxID=652788 RepID=A0A562UBW7_9SPHI|nr:outer membrane protein TolC [Mucilaginibacter frigoritolerans]
MTMTTQNNKKPDPHLLKNVITILKSYAVPALVITMLFGTTAMAQDRTITLKEAVTLGIQNSKTLKLSKSKIDEAISQYEQAKDKSLPSASASFGYDRAEIPANTIKFGTASIGLPKNDNAWLGTVSASETILGAHKLKYARESTELLSQVSRLDADNDKDQITYDVISSYYNLYKVLQSKKVVQQNLNSIDQQIKQSQRFFDQGLVTKNDVLRFQLQRANIELNGIDLETNRKIINYNLDIMLGLPENTNLAIDTITEADRQLAPLTNYIDTAMLNRIELKQYDLRTQVAETSIKDVKANAMPTLAASAQAYYVGIAADPLPKTGTYITPIVFGLNLSWNFSTLWNNKNKVTQAKIQREEVIETKNIAIDNVKKEVNQDYQNYTMALDKIKLLQTSIDQAGENNKILESKYKSNIASATDRVDAETLLYQAEINLELAKADAGLAYYTLLKSTGKLNK